MPKRFSAWANCFRTKFKRGNALWWWSRPWAKPPTPWKQCGRLLKKMNGGACGRPTWKITWRWPKRWAFRPRSRTRCAVAWKAVGKPRSRCAPNPWMPRTMPWWRQGSSQAPPWWRLGFRRRACRRHGGMCATRCTPQVRIALRASMSPRWAKRERRCAPAWPKPTWWSPKASSGDTPTAARARWAGKAPITALPCLLWRWVPRA